MSATNPATAPQGPWHEYVRPVNKVECASELPEDWAAVLERLAEEPCPSV